MQYVRKQINLVDILMNNANALIERFSSSMTAFSSEFLC